MKNPKSTEVEPLSKVKVQVAETDVNLSGIKVHAIDY